MANHNPAFTLILGPVNKTLSTFPSLFLLGLHTNLRISCFSFLFFPCVSYLFSFTSLLISTEEKKGMTRLVCILAPMKSQNSY